MTTWLDIRREALTLLGVDPDASTSDDIRNVVDYKMKHVRDQLYRIRVPRSLLVISDIATVEATTEYIGITSSDVDNPPTVRSFELTDFRKLYTLLIDGEDWEYVPYGAWVRANSAAAGEQRFKWSFTVDSENRIYLYTPPGTGDTYDARLVYFKNPDAIVDGGTVEVEPEYEELLVLGIVLRFPNQFQSEERLALFAALNKQYDDLFKQYKADNGSLKSTLRWRPYVRRRLQRSVNFGNGETF